MDPFTSRFVVGKEYNFGRERSDTNDGLDGTVVLKLIVKANVPCDQGHNVYFHNYLTCVQLMKELAGKKMCIRNLLIKQNWKMFNAI